MSTAPILPHGAEWYTTMSLCRRRTGIAKKLSPTMKPCWAGTRPKDMGRKIGLKYRSLMEKDLQEQCPLLGDAVCYNTLV